MKTRLEGVSLQGKKGEAAHIRPDLCWLVAIQLKNNLDGDGS